MATAAPQKHPFLPGSNTDEFDQGSKAAPAFRKARKRAVFLPLPFHCHPLFQFFFSFWCTEAGANLSHLFFSRKQQSEMCFIFRRLSRQPHRPYCVQVGVFVRETCQEKPRPGQWAPAWLPGHTCHATHCGRAAKQHPHWIYE